MYGRTVFVIAHRLSTVKNADVIMVLWITGDHRERAALRPAHRRATSITSFIQAHSSWSDALFCQQPAQPVGLRKSAGCFFV